MRSYTNIIVSLRRRHSASLSAFVTGISISLLAACAGDKAFAPSTDAHALLRSVRLSEHAYNMAVMAPYDTAQLHVTAMMADGSPSLAPVQYSVNDSGLVVDSSGLLRVRSPLVRAAAATVYAAVTVSGVVRRDSAFVHVVVTQPQVPVRFAISDTDFNTSILWTIPRERAWPNLGLVGIGQWGAYDAAGVPQSGLVARTSSSDTTVLKTADPSPYGIFDLTSFNVDMVAPGHAWMYASMYAYGKTFRDSVEVVIKRPQLYGITSSVDQQVIHGVVDTVVRFHPDSINVPAGADVSWFAPQVCVRLTTDLANPSCKGTSINVDFDAPQYALASRIPPAYGTTPDVYGSVYNSIADIWRTYYNLIGGTGNIAPFAVMLPDTRTVACSDVIPLNCRFPAPDGSTLGGEARRFVTPGHYHYHSAQGATGVIVVE